MMEKHFLPKKNKVKTLKRDHNKTWRETKSWEYFIFELSSAEILILPDDFKFYEQIIRSFFLFQLI